MTQDGNDKAATTWLEWPMDGFSSDIAVVQGVANDQVAGLAIGSPAESIASLTVAVYVVP